MNATSTYPTRSWYHFCVQLCGQRSNFCTSYREKTYDVTLRPSFLHSSYLEQFLFVLTCVHPSSEVCGNMIEMQAQATSLHYKLIVSKVHFNVVGWISIKQFCAYQHTRNGVPSMDVQFHNSSSIFRSCRS